MTKTSVKLDAVSDEQARQLKQILGAFGEQAAPVLLKRIAGINKRALQLVLDQANKLKAPALTALVDSLIEPVTTLAGLAPPDSRYLFVKEIEIVVPDNYQHETRLDHFRAEHRTAFYGYNDAITDANFSPKATTKLVPGQRLKVAIFDIKKNQTVTSDDNLKFIRSKNGILTGAHGSSLVWEQRREELPKRRWYVSFDEKDVLWKDADGDHRVSDVYAGSDGGFHFNLGDFEGGWDGNDSLLVFRDEFLEA